MAEQKRPRPLAALQRLVQRSTPLADAVPERCDLCSELLPPAHRHLVEVAMRQLTCVCRACSILFDQAAASQGRYRLVPERSLSLEDFQISAAQWDSLHIPVGLAFFFYSTAAQQVIACYPSPAGATEAHLDLSTWQELAEEYPVLHTLQHDVEALLVNRARGARQYFTAPIDECYRLVGVIRLHWRGLGGGREVWQEVERFFATLKERSKPMWCSEEPAATEGEKHWP